MQWGNRPQEPSCALQFWIQKMAKIVYSEEKEQKIKLGKDRWRVVNSGDRSRFACSMRQGNWGQKVKATALTWKSKKEQKGKRSTKRAGEEGHGSSAGAAVGNIRGWNSSVPRNCWVWAFPGAEETILTKKPRPRGRLDKHPGSAALGPLLPELGQEVWKQLVPLVTGSPRQLRLQRQQELRNLQLILWISFWCAPPVCSLSHQLF